MKVSEANESSVKRALRIDFDDDDEYIRDLIIAAKAFLVSETSLTEEELDEYPEMIHALNCLCADMYDNRGMTVSSGKPNPTVERIIALHRRNYV